MERLKDREGPQKHAPADKAAVQAAGQHALVDRHLQRQLILQPAAATPAPVLFVKGVGFGLGAEAADMRA